MDLRSLTIVLQDLRNAAYASPKALTDAWEQVTEWAKQQEQGDGTAPAARAVALLASLLADEDNTGLAETLSIAKTQLGE